jgi:Heat induced stress protein YflT domain
MTMADRTGATRATGYTVAGVFNSEREAEQALSALKDAGFTPDQVSVVAKDTRGTQQMVERSDMAGAETTGATAGAFLGGLTGGVAGWLIGIGALAIPGIGPIVAAGALATTLGGAAVGAVAGGLLGALVGAGIPEDDARTYETHVKEGRILITTQANSSAQAQEARDAFDRYDGSEVRAYETTGVANTTAR